MESYEVGFLNSLAITVIIETLALYFLARFAFKKPENKIWIILLAGITASCATLPYLWFIFPMFLKTKVLYHIVSELFAIVAESFILLGFLRITYNRAFAISFSCNLISYGCGLIINAF